MQFINAMQSKKNNPPLAEEYSLNQEKSPRVNTSIYYKIKYFYNELQN